MELVGKNKNGDLFINEKAFNKIKHVISECLPLAGNLLEAIESKKTFVEWAYNIPEDLVEKYADNNNKDEENKEDAIDEDIFLTSTFFLCRYKNDMLAKHTYKEVSVMNKVIPVILSNISIIRQLNKKWPDTEIIKLSALNSETWDPNELYVESYFKHTSTDDDKYAGTIVDEPQTKYSLFQLLMHLNEEKRPN